MNEQQEERTTVTRLREAIAGFERLRHQPLTFATLETRWEQVATARDVLESVEGPDFDPSPSPPSGSVGKFLDELRSLRQEEMCRLRHSCTDPNLISEAWQLLEQEHLRRFPGEDLDRSTVLSVLRGEPDWELTDYVLDSVTAAPLDQDEWEYTLLRCPAWFHRVLAAELADRHTRPGTLTDAVTGATEEEIEHVLVLWGDDPEHVFFKPENALETIRAL